MDAIGSVLTNKYTEGYPGKRYYGGNLVIDEIEILAIERVKALFGAEHANVQPHSGANANMARLPGAARARRHGPRAEPRSRRPPHPRLAGQRLGPVLQLRRRTRSRRATSASTIDQIRDLAPQAPPEDDRRRQPPPTRASRSRAVPRDLRRGWGTVHVRRRPYRRAGRRRRPSEPGALRRHCHLHDPQDAARAAGWLHRVQGRIRRGRSTRPIFPGLQGGPARARHRRQGSGVPRGCRTRASPTTPIRSWPTPGRWHRAWPRRVPACFAVAPTTT